MGRTKTKKAERALKREIEKLARANEQALPSPPVTAPEPDDTPIQQSQEPKEKNKRKRDPECDGETDAERRARKASKKAKKTKDSNGSAHYDSVDVDTNGDIVSAQSLKKQKKKKRRKNIDKEQGDCSLLIATQDDTNPATTFNARIDRETDLDIKPHIDAEEHLYRVDDNMECELQTVFRASEVVPSQAELELARSQLVQTLPEAGHGSREVGKHIEEDLVPAFERHNKSPNYFGFVTGGTTPASLHADHVVVETDQTAQVYLPKETIAVEVEDCAMRMLCELFDLDQSEWTHRILTTGATASNVLGLACGREFVIREAAKSKGTAASVAEDGIVSTMYQANLHRIQILTTVPHSSLRKAASILGLGRTSVRDISLPTSPNRFDLPALASALSEPNTASIIAISASEVNTGLFATTGPELAHIRDLCDQHAAWLHIDAAFGLLARVLSPTNPAYSTLLSGVSNLHLADSITGDAHKLLNVPYDSGIFLSRHLDLATAVFQNPNAAYLAPAANSNIDTHPALPSPLNIGLENSRRFRALPLYATLAAYGRSGYRSMLERQIKLARSIAAYIADSDAYELLPAGIDEDSIFIIVLFRAKNEGVNEALVQRVNASRRIYVSGTKWEGRAAARFAVASWMVVPEREMVVIKEVLEEAVR